ncbi:hypothetical protein YPPY64_3764, partial [Yersinia pestis PY-64]
MRHAHHPMAAATRR